VPALVHHVFMYTFKDSINLKPPPFFWQQLEFRPKRHWRVEETCLRLQTGGHTWPYETLFL